MAAITPIVRTHVINVTKQDLKYGWYPPHGLFVEARKTVIVDGDVMSMTRPQFQKLLINDLDNKRVKLSVEVLDRKGVGIYSGDKTVKVNAKPEQPKPQPKLEVKKAQDEAQNNEDAIVEKLTKIETGEEPVEPFSETFQDKTIEEMKPPVQDIFPPDAFPDSDAPTKKANVEVVDMFGAEAFGDDSDTVADKAQAAADEAKAEAAAKAKRSAAAKKAAATRKANQAKKAAEAAQTEETNNFGNME
jgi:hypothetical protein